MLCFLAGEPLRFLPRLGEFLGSYAFGYSNEQPCEGLHAQVERKTGSITNRTEAYDSLCIRVPFFRDLMLAQKQGRLGNIEDVALGLADCLHQARNPKTLITLLGFENHKSCKGDAGEDLHSWDSRFRQVVYCADDYTMFHMKKPDIHFTSDAAMPELGRAATKSNSTETNT